jgi:Fur family ferric uptake transcriptional regulator
MSKQRRAILEAIEELKCHPTADEVYELVRQKLPRISLGTVYRNLEILSSTGIIRKVQLGGAQMHFDDCRDDHYHIRCLRCDRVDDLPLESLDLSKESLSTQTGYKILGHCLEFIGVCPECQKDEDGHEAA